MWQYITSKNIKCLYHCVNSDFETLEQFINANKFNMIHYFTNTQDIKTILTTGKSNKSSWNITEEEPPRIDHAIYFKNSSNKICCLTYNSYYPADKVRQEVEQWAAERELKATVYDAKYSWYAPNSTCFVVISLPDVTVKLK